MSKPTILNDDTVYHTEIVCPHCHTEWGDSCEYTNDQGEETCDACGKRFTYTRDIEITYTTEKIEEEEQ